jgi:class 3 adenylate cyclase
MKPLPTGVVSFLLSDAEASSAIWRKEEAAADAAFARLDALVGEVVSAGNGIVIKARGEGDSHFAVFARASEAVAASVALQRRLARATWPPDTAIAVRIAVHTGEPLCRGGDYFGSVVNEAARLRSLGHGGQTLVSAVTAALSRYLLDEDISMRSLGTFRIRDFRQPEEVFQVVAPDLTDVFPPLRALDTVPPPIAIVVRLDVVDTRRLLQAASYEQVTEAGERFAQFARHCFDRCGGYALQVIGDEVTAAFATPNAALDFIEEVQTALLANGYEIRAGLHAGTVEVTPRGPAGLPVLVAAELANLAGEGEVVATRTVADLIQSGDVNIERRPGAPPSVLRSTWQLYTVTTPRPASSEEDTPGSTHSS